ncbi:GAF domain-containing protein [Planomonospora sp. ID91781]|uniref:ATP-binding protein n=1 Tax=Planomonospora sp. ID91781 TaxID=2738135 RepID=UPI0018C3C10B|nr:ATP-binding protein [Planomonospora sp. ID91781]MBG0823102.1 GAF domain-containing protein [Planomonospora sp. ID91781]
MSATDHIHDAQRLRTLHATGLLEAEEVPPLDRVTRLAVGCLHVPAAVVSLIDADRQVVISAAGSARPERHWQTPLSQTLCRHIVITDAPLTVPDTRADERWREVEAARDGRVASYAGMPLRAGRGRVLGTLCVIDAEPRQWSGEQLAMLEDLAAMAEAEIVTRLTRNEPHASAVLDRVPEPIACLDAAGVVTGWNAAAVRLFGWPAAEAVDRPVSELISPERVRGDCERLLRRVREGDASAREVHRLELTAADRAGREFPAELVAQVSAGGDGPICQVVLHDVGDRDEIRRQLEGEQLFLRALVDSLDVMIGACDSDGRVVLVNRPLRQGTHAPWPEVHVQDAGEVFEVFAADGRTPLRGDQVPLARALAGEHIDGQQIIARLPGEEPRCFAVNGRPIDAPDGRRLGAVVALHDITAQHRAQVLRSAQHAVAEVLADAASVQEAAGGVVAAVTEALGWTYGEYWQVDEDGGAESGGSIASIAFWSRPGRDLSAFTDGQPTTFTRGQDLPGLAWERGEPVWIGDMAAESGDFSRLQGAVRAGLRSAMALPVRSGDHVLGVLIFGADRPQPPDDDLVELLDGVCAHLGRYMERRRAEELTVALAESRRQFDRIINQLTDKAWTVEIRPDGTARPVYVNTEHTTVFGGRLHLSPDDDFIAVMLRFVHPDDHDAFRAYCAELITGDRAELEYRLIGLDGVTRWIWSRGAPRREGERLLVDGISSDVTDRRRITEEREGLLAQQHQQVERLRQLDAMKDDLMAMASHELRNPIGIIRSYAEMLAEAPGLPEEYRTFIEVIDRKSEHLQNLVDDLLDLARLDAGRVVVDARPVWLTGLVRQAVDEHRAAAQAGRITLTAELAHHLHVHADPVRLRQVLDNLLSNAVKYTPAGGAVTVTAGCDSADTGAGNQEACRGEAITVTVADTGIGIPAEQYDQLFSRFFRASTAKAAGIKGTGLGLAITKAIIEAHGGAITAAPRAGGGTVFTVRLPADPSHRAEPA